MGGELDTERAQRQKVEKAKNALATEMQAMADQLDESGGATQAQVEQLKRREGEFIKIKKGYEELVIKSDQDIAEAKKKAAAVAADLTDQLESMMRTKAKAEKERNQLAMEVADLQSELDEMASAKSRVESNAESAAATAACEDVESKLNQLQRQKTNMASTVEELRGQVEEEHKSKSSVAHALAAARQDIDLLKEQVEEEQEAKDVLQRALSKSNAEVANWRSKYES